MPEQRDYTALLADFDLPATPHRLRVLEIIGNSPGPISHKEIHRHLRDSHPINRVTLYRILDLLVERNLVERISSGDRSFRYALCAESTLYRHPHFYCDRCGNMECLQPETLNLDLESVQAATSALVRRIEVRLDGICRKCLQKADSQP